MHHVIRCHQSTPATLRRRQLPHQCHHQHLWLSSNRTTTGRQLSHQSESAMLLCSIMTSWLMSISWWEVIPVHCVFQRTNMCWPLGALSSLLCSMGVWLTPAKISIYLMWNLLHSSICSSKYHEIDINVLSSVYLEVSCGISFPLNLDLSDMYIRKYSV